MQPLSTPREGVSLYAGDVDYRGSPLLGRGVGVLLL